ANITNDPDHLVSSTSSGYNESSKTLSGGANLEKATVTRKTDRRTLYTKGVIKQALLELMEVKSFEKITITDICKKAEINRGTYYLHYYELSEVLNELLDEALTDASGLLGQLQISDTCAANECSNSLCYMVRHSQKYKVVFLDESLTSRIIEKIAALHKETFVKEIRTRCNINAKQAEAIFYFQINGCFAISKAGRSLDCNDWIKIRRAIDCFIAGGLEKIISGTVT
ncbi:MAG: TetR/AcrR family transcriptional regulator, partial [Bacillota bacterium]